MKSGPGLKMDRHGTRSTLAPTFLKFELALTRLKNLTYRLVKIAKVRTDILEILPILTIKPKVVILHFYFIVNKIDCYLIIPNEKAEPFAFG